MYAPPTRPYLEHFQRVKEAMDLFRRFQVGDERQHAPATLKRGSPTRMATVPWTGWEQNFLHGTVFGELLRNHQRGCGLMRVGAHDVSLIAQRIDGESKVLYAFYQNIQTIKFTR